MDRLSKGLSRNQRGANMLARHLLTHLGIAAAAVLILPLFGMSWPTALLIGLMAGCASMAFGSGHDAERHGTADRPDSKHARVDAEE